jgi:hypothetical protein
MRSKFDTAPLRAEGGGQPMIRYVRGSPPIGVHGDEDGSGLVPSAYSVTMFHTHAKSKPGHTGSSSFLLAAQRRVRLPHLALSSPPLVLPGSLGASAK